MFVTTYTVNEEKNTMLVERRFAATRDRVWKAWTDSALLDQWWAPKPWKAVTKLQEFKEGGMWLYAMEGPEGDKHWAMLEYETIKPQDSFSAVDSFCDEEGNKNAQLPSNHWLSEFAASGEETLVKITIQFSSAESLKQLIAMGFKEGFAMGHENLDELLARK